MTHKSNGSPPGTRGQRVANGPGTCAEESAVVVTVTVADAGFVPSGVTATGETEQVAAKGAPEQLNEIGWLKPPLG